jgi:hypothetical protein
VVDVSREKHEKAESWVFGLKTGIGWLQRGKVGVTCDKVNVPRDRVSVTCGKVGLLRGKVSVACGKVSLLCAGLNGLKVATGADNKEF